MDLKKECYLTFIGGISGVSEIHILLDSTSGIKWPQFMDLRGKKSWNVTNTFICVPYFKTVNLKCKIKD